MKKQIITLVAVASIAAGYTMAYAAAGSNGGGIVNSKHDMNLFLTTNGGVKDTDSRTCAYCHTPHHAAAPGQMVDVQVGATTVSYEIYSPLWSRTLANGNYDQYVSATFNPAALDKFYDPMAGPSRLCMSCHDGSIAVDSYYGKTGTVAQKGDDLMNYFGSNHFAVGAAYGLSNDHPVGFVYNDMLLNADMELRPSSTSFGTGGKTIDAVLTDIKDVGKVMTCASCHDVHNGPSVLNKTPASGRGYFLLATQTDSALCLTCHDKNR